ncbi:MAG: hypothetical protein PHE78_04875 [Candidatus Gastranaerophilales bacterium]|nr:hypothetical protein [Candidatus Gastranaerophilales bacterium]
MNNINSNYNVNNTNNSPSQSFGQGYLANLHYNLKNKESYDEYIARKKQQHKRNLITVIGSSAAVLGAGFIFLMTGRSQNISKKIQNMSAVFSSKWNNGKNKHLHKFLTVMAGGFDRFAKVITNSTPIKDYFVFKLMDRTAFTRKLRDGISRLYTKENISSVQKSRKQAVSSYRGLISTVEDAIGESELNPSLIRNKEKSKELKELLVRTKNVPEFLSGSNFKNAYSRMENDMDYLSQEISMKRLRSKEVFEGFVPETILMDRREKYAKGLFESKNKVSCTFSDLSEYAREKLNTSNILIYSIKDLETQRNLRNASIQLDNSLKHFVRDSVNKANRSENRKAVQEAINKYKLAIDSVPSGGVKEKLLKQIDECDEVFSNKDMGILQQIRVLAGDAWGDKSHFDLKVKKAARKSHKDLNLSLTRMVNMFDKQRDITLGSGPTDVFGLLSPLAVYGYFMAKDKTKEERVGTSLELGVPIVGGTGIYLWTLAKQYNGVRAFATSLGTGIILNTIGSEIFKRYKASVDKKKALKNPEQVQTNATLAQAAQQRKLNAQNQYQVQNVSLN